MTAYEQLYTADEMRGAEEAYPGFPASAAELMERAGRAVADEVLLSYPTAHRVAVVCGKGANGGDGRIAARLLREAGRDAYEGEGLGDADLIVDALFGTGFRGEPRAEAAALIDEINRAGVPVVSVDVPSGVDASTGEVAGAAVRADVTVTFHAEKIGLRVSPGRRLAGRVTLADIGLSARGTTVRRATPSVLERVPLRSADDTKYSAGHVVVVGGAEGMAGAAVLAATAAMRADAGYVTLCVPRESLGAAEAHALEPVTRGFAWESAAGTVFTACERAGAIALGPGLGRSEAAGALVRELLTACAHPAVVDADGLYGFEPVLRQAPTVLTPHGGELGRLLGRDSAWVSAHRLEAVRSAADRFGCIILLKGVDTLVASPDGSVVLCDEGPPSLATAGTGDVLTGVIAAFLAKGVAPVDATVAAAVAHGLAARAAPHRAGLVASDVVRALPRVLDEHCVPAAP